MHHCVDDCPMKIKRYQAKKKQLEQEPELQPREDKNDIHECGEPFAAKVLGEKPASIVFMTNARKAFSHTCMGFTALCIHNA